jgi:hypothetical protein
MAATEAVTAGDSAIAQVVSRISGEHVLRAFQLLLDGFGGIRAAVLLQAINTANIGALSQTEAGRRTAGADGIFPDEVRRPVSITRLADSSGMPFESTRRIVKELVDARTCVRTESGVILPRATLEAPSMMRISGAILGYIRRFVRDLEAVGLVDDSAPKRAAQGNEEEGAMGCRAAPFSNEYILRFVQLLAASYGDVRRGIVAQTIVTANTAHLEGRMGKGWRYAGIGELPPDDMRKPISGARLAESLGFPHETMRQHVRRLIDSGVCIRVDGGLIVPRAVSETPAAMRAALVNVAYARKFVRDLRAIGIGAAAA